MKKRALFGFFIMFFLNFLLGCDQPSVEFIKSNNANLSNLTVSEGSLSPSFDSDVTAYTVNVGLDISEITITVELDDLNAEITSIPIFPVNLNVGDNIIHIIVTAENGTEKTYSIVVTRHDTNLINVMFNRNADDAYGTMPQQEFIMNLAGVLNPCKYYRIGYDFKGWSLTPEGSIFYQDEANYINDSNETLYAIWSRNTFTVTFNPNGGDGSVFSQEFILNQEKELYHCIFRRSGYRFMGWSTTVDGPVVYNNRSKYLTGAEDITLYAVWSNSQNAASDFTYTITDGKVTLTGYTADYSVVIIPDQIEGYPVTNIESEIFYDDQSYYSNRIKEIYIPDTVTTIANKAFSIYSLEVIRLSNSITEISQSMFYSCRNLRKIEIPEGVSSLRSGAFYSCVNLESISLPDSLQIIESDVFFDCQELTSIDIPASVLSIDEDNFTWCSKLETINVDVSSVSYISVDGILYSKDQTVLMRYPPAKPGSVYVIPEGVKRISSHAFYGCNNLIDISIPSSVSSIDTYDGKTFTTISLKNITVAESNLNFCSIDGVLFSESQKSLIKYPLGKTQSNYTVPDSVLYIGYYSFCGQPYLEYLTLPEGVTRIWNYALYSSNLVSVTINSITPPEIIGILFHPDNDRLQVYVPSGTLNDYQNDLDWSDYTDLLIEQ